MDSPKCYIQSFPWRATGKLPCYQTVYLADRGKAMGVLQTQLSALAMELEGGGLADGRILQLVQVSIGRVCYQQG